VKCTFFGCPDRAADFVLDEVLQKADPFLQKQRFSDFSFWDGYGMM